MPRAADDCRIAVGCRVRPLNEQEVDLGSGSVWTCCGESGRIWRTAEDAAAAPAASRSTKAHGPAFQYDHVFGEEADNDDVYEKLGQPIISGVLDGFHGTIFAYGQTSSGKTHTLLGTAEEMGVIVHSVHDIFEYVSRAPPEMEFLIRVSYLEIYNEEVRDLLGGTTESGGLRIVDDPQRGCHVRGLKEVVVLSPDHVFELLRSGEAKRHYGATKMNYTSSRSHTLFRMVVESRTDINEETKQAHEDEEEGGGGSAASDDDDASSVGGKVVQVSQLNLVDLAGSERVSKTEATGARLKEGAAINRSLLVLGTVINKLADGHKGHIPFRDSKLTRLLSNSLGGNAKTAVVCTLSPAARNYDESKSTLQFASRAKTIVNKAVKNHVMDKSALLDQYKQEVAQLKLQLASGGSVVDLPELSQVRQQLREEESKRQALEVQTEQHKAALQEMRKLVLLTSKLAANPAVSGELQERIRAVADGSAPPQKVLREVEALMEAAEKEQRSEDGIGDDEKLSFEQLSKILNLKRTKRKRRRLSSLCQSIVTTMAEQRKAEEIQETAQLCKDHRVDQLQRDLEEIVAERDALVAKNATESTKNSAERDALVAERDALAAERDALLADRDTFAAARDESAQKAQEAWNQVARATQRAQELGESLLQKNALLEDLQSRLGAAEEERDVAQTQFKEAASKADRSQAQIEALSQERADLSARLEHRERAAADHDGEVEKLTRELKIHETTSTELKTHLVVAQEQGEALKSQLASTEAELGSLRTAHAQLASDRDELEKLTSTTVQRQEKQLNNLLARLEQQQSRSNAQLGSLKERIATYERLQEERNVCVTRSSSADIHIRAALLDFCAGLEAKMQAVFATSVGELTRQGARVEQLALRVGRAEVPPARTSTREQQQATEIVALKSELASLASACRAAQDRALVLQERAAFISVRPPRQEPSVGYNSLGSASSSPLQRRREESLVREIDDLKTRLGAAEASALATRESACSARERSQLIQELEALALELECTREDLRSAGEGRDALKSRCLELELELDRAKEDLVRATRSTQLLREQVHDKLEHVTEAWESSRAENRQLRRQLREAQHSTRGLRNAAAEAQQEAAHATETFLAYQRGAEEREAHLELLLAGHRQSHRPSTRPSLKSRMALAQERLREDSEAGSEEEKEWGDGHASAGEIANLRSQLDAAHDELDVFKRLDVYSASLKRGLRSYRPQRREGEKAAQAAPAPSRERTERLLRILQDQR